MSVTCVRGVSVDDRNNQIAGCAFAVLQAVLYSTMGILGKLLYATGMDSQQVVILASVVVITLGPLLQKRKQE